MSRPSDKKWVDRWIVAEIYAILSSDLRLKAMELAITADSAIPMGAERLMAPTCPG